MHMLDPGLVEPESEIQEEYGDPQASSCVGANIVCEQGNPGCIPSIFPCSFV
jgi:hypothetical protein